LVVVVVAAASPYATADPASRGQAEGVSPHWDGWGNNWLRDVKVLSSKDVWLAGDRPFSPFFRPIVRHFDGVRWTNLPEPQHPRGTVCYATSIDGLADDDMWLTCSQSVTGIPNIEHWDGTSWQIQDLPPVGSIVDLWHVWVDTPTDIWVAGDAQTEGKQEGLVLHYDGHAWTQQRLPANNGTRIFGVSGTSPDDVWVVGSTNGTGRTYALHWDGATWTETPTLDPSLIAGLESVTAIAPDDVWAAGFNSSYPHSTGVLLHWDGHTWSDIDSPVLKGTFLFGIHAVTGDDVWAVGSKNERPIAVHWDGSHWRSVPPRHPAPVGDERLLAVSGDAPDDVWAAGYSSSRTGNHWARMHQRWNGKGWSRDYP
jgi:hypothetical protein